MPIFLLIFLLLGSLLLPPETAAAKLWPGIQTRDQNPLLQLRYLPQNSALAAGQFEFDLALINTEHFETPANESLLVDIEIHRLDLRLAWQAWDRLWWLQMPILYSGPGWMDSAVYDWHDFWHLPQGGRSPQHYDRYAIVYRRQGQTLLQNRSGRQGLGDLSLATSLSESGNWHWQAGVEIPLNDWQELGGGGLELGLWASRSWPVTDTITAYASLGASTLLQPADAPYHSTLLIGQLGVSSACWPGARCVAQLDGHSASAKDTETRLLGPALQLTLAWETHWNEQILRLYLNEDVLVGSSADFALGLQWHSHWD